CSMNELNRNIHTVRELGKTIIVIANEVWQSPLLAIAKRLLRAARNDSLYYLGFAKSSVTFLIVLLLLSASGCENAAEPNSVEGMVHFEGGAITIGTNTGMPNERPAHKIEVE